MLKQANLVLRVLMELGIIVGLGYWGFHTGQTERTKMLLAIAAPALGFGTWGLVDFRQMGALGEPVRLAQELVISGLAAVAWYLAGQHALGWGLGVASVVHHILVYATGETLLKQ